MSKQLDITDLKETGLDLVKAINNAVAEWETSTKILKPLPGELLMTPTQYKDLMALSYLDPMQEDKWDFTTGEAVLVPSDDRMFATEKNVMEVRVKGDRLDA